MQCCEMNLGSISYMQSKCLTNWTISLVPSSYLLARQKKALGTLTTNAEYCVLPTPNVAPWDGPGLHTHKGFMADFLHRILGFDLSVNTVLKGSLWLAFLLEVSSPPEGSCLWPTPISTCYKSALCLVWGSPMAVLKELRNL